MSTLAIATSGTLSASAQIAYAREILQVEGQSLLSLAERIDGEFCRAVEYLYRCRGSVLVTGMGKAGLIGQKVAATLASTGTRSHFLHPAEAVHGDLGRIHRDDVILVLSQSGETEEVVRLLPSFAELRVPVLAITCRRTSTLAAAAAVVLDLGPLVEACALGLAPSTSTTTMLAMGDSLALVTSRMRDFSRDDFARFHPAGNLGRQLSRVEDHMRPLTDCRVARQTLSVREILVAESRTGRRSGAILLVDEQEKLSGIFTDSDLARLLEKRRDAAIDGPISTVMTPLPCSVAHGSLMAEAVATMARKKISELPVIDADGKPVGLIDITDVVGLFPDVEPAVAALQTTPVILSAHPHPGPRKANGFEPRSGRRDRA